MVAYYTTGNYKKLSKIIKSTRNFKKIFVLNIESIVDKCKLNKVEKIVAAYILAEYIKVSLKKAYLSKKYSSVVVVHKNISQTFLEEFFELCDLENIYFTQNILYDYDDSIDMKLYGLFDYVM